MNAKGQDSLIRENFSSVTHFVRAAAPLMPDRGGSIVNITSIEAHRAGPGYAVYSAMKAAVASLTKSLALELGPRRIRVNCIAPDVIPTPGIGMEHGVHTPLPYAGHVDDIAGAAVFLASDLSRFVTGTTVHVDGGNWASGGWVRQDDGSYRLHRTPTTIPTAGVDAVKFGIALGRLNPAFFVEATVEAERLGYESVWLPEHLIFTTKMSRSPHPGETHPPVPPDTPIFDAFAYLSYLAGRHRAPATRDARLQPRAAPSVHRGACRADARHRLGWSRRVRHRCELARGGVGSPSSSTSRSRGQRVDEAVEICKQLWTEAEVSHHGEFFSFDGAVFEPKCVQEPYPPILVGGESGAALRRAARLGDGWIGMSHDLESGAAQIATLRTLLEEQGRDPATVPVLPRRPRRVAGRRRALGGDRRHTPRVLAVATRRRRRSTACAASPTPSASNPAVEGRRLSRGYSSRSRASGSPSKSRIVPLLRRDTAICAGCIVKHTPAI